MEDTEVMAIDADRLYEQCEKDPAMGYHLMLKIAQNTRLPREVFTTW